MNTRFCGLILIGMMMLFQTNFARGKTAHNISVPNSIPIFSGLHTLSIHVRDTITHNSVYHFLVDKLKLPVYYYPVASGNRKYAGVYAGNMILEPCGPYTEYLYASSSAKALFFGLTFEPFESLTLAAKGLSDRNIDHKVMDREYIYFTDSSLCRDNITITLMDDGGKTVGKNRKIDSLKYAMAGDTQNELGIEYLKEIRIGYKGDANLQKWKELISPAELKENKIWEESKLLQFYFIKSEIKEVQSITFKVRSIEKAKGYLSKNNLIGSFIDNKIELDRGQTFGLSIFITDEN